jgi:hypothetical protein
MTTITVDEAEDIAWGEHVAVQPVSEHRWYDKQLVVFERDGALMGLHYLKPKTEMQEGQDRFEGDPSRPARSWRPSTRPRRRKCRCT